MALTSLRLCKLPINKAIAQPLVQFVRFNRKPRWVPVAKSKEFYVREPTPIDPDEYAELKLRYARYRAAVRSIRAFLQDETQETAPKQNLQNSANTSATDFAWMEQQVKSWNAHVASARDSRQAELDSLEEKRLQQLVQEQAERRLQQSLTAEKQLLRNKAVVGHFITEENLDQEIETMLDSRRDYNFAIDRHGNILHGEYPNSAK